MTASNLFLAALSRVTPGAVAVRLFEIAKEMHVKAASGSDCNCSYCLSLREYVRKKLALHRLKKCEPCGLRFENFATIQMARHRMQEEIWANQAYKNDILARSELKAK